MFRAALLAALALPLSLLETPGPVPRAPDYWPTAGWRTSSPQAERVNADSLAALDAAFAAGRHGYIGAMLVIRNGKVIYERRYTQPYDSLYASWPGPDRRDWQYNYQHPNHHPWYQKTDLHTLQSVSKSVTSVLTGVAIHRGDLPHDSVAVMPYLADYPVADQDPRRARMTLRHLLTMTAGIEWDEWTASYSDSSNNCIQMEASNEWVPYVLSLPMAREPGDTFVYNSGATVLLGAVLQQATGQRADQYAKTHLFAPLGITAFHWKVSPDGVADTEGGLYLAPRDLAKIGYLFLADGIWDGKRLLPEGWVARSTTPVLEIRPGGPQYGYLWWMPPKRTTGPRAFMAQGFGGQVLLVVPDLSLIAVFNGWNIYDKPALNTGMVLSRLVASTAP